MNGTRIAPLQTLEAPEVPEGDQLLLIEPRRVPPHLGFISDGLYHSLSVKGVEVGKEASSVLAGLERKGKELLLIGLGPLPASPSSQKAFMAYEGMGPPCSSCLPPIIDRCGFAPKDIKTVHELFATLAEREMLRPPFFVLNVPLSANAEELWIPAYEEADVHAHLRRYAKDQQSS